MICAFARLTLRPHQATLLNKCSLHVSPVLAAEPLKKKKKLDPMIIKQREDRRRKKLEKQIRRLERNARQLKPIDELEVPFTLIDEKNLRTRKISPLSPQQSEERALLMKEWAKYKMNEKLHDYQLIDELRQSQERALEELRNESEELYLEAIQPDLALINFKTKGPVATPPINDYNSPDGEYLDISKKWE